MDSRRGPIEVAISTDLRGAPYSFSLWDVHTGAQLVAFKGNKSSPINNCLKLIDNNYFITATDNVLQIWSIYNRKCQDQKLFLPDRPSTLCISPCGNFLIVGISEMIYIWQLCSGNLLAHTQRHYQTVTVLKINQDGTFFFSGGEDGMVLVWPFSDLISGNHNTGALGFSQSRADVGINEPRFTWQHHSAKITDIHSTNSGLCITASIDKTINIYSYSYGKRLHCIADWPSPIWSVAMNKNETRLYLGGQDGNIYELAICSLSLSQIISRDKDDQNERKPIFSGHKDRVDHLSISLDGSLLISGSHDSTCKIWDIPSAKMLRDIKHQAPLANLATLLVPDAFSLTSMTQSQTKAPLLVKPLKRSIYKIPRDLSLSKGDLFDEASTTIVNIKNNVDLFEQSEAKKPIAIQQNLEGIKSNDRPNSDELAVPDLETNSESVKNLKGRLRELYLLSAEKVFKDFASESLHPYSKMMKTSDDSGKIGVSSGSKRNCPRRDTKSNRVVSNGHASSKEYQQDNPRPILIKKRSI